MPPTELKPSKDSRWPSWKIHTSTPYAAPTDSRFSTIAVAGITSERKVTSSSRNASASTNTKTHGARAFMRSLKSLDIAVLPVTDAFTPGSRSSVAGRTCSRRAASARLDVASVPLPATAIVTTPTARSRLRVKPNGSRSSPVASAR